MCMYVYHIEYVLYRLGLYRVCIDTADRIIPALILMHINAYTYNCLDKNLS